MTKCSNTFKTLPDVPELDAPQRSGVPLTDKEKRQEEILSIVNKLLIDSQDKLLALLRLKGYKATQATLSRDIKELGIVKIHDESGYHYVVREITREAASKQSVGPIVSIEVSGQLAVIHTRPGYASMTAATLDEAHIPDVMGTIAGDDTVIIALREGADTQQTQKKLTNIFPLTPQHSGAKE